jgi:Domain of unknown function (DUF6542)
MTQTRDLGQKARMQGPPRRPSGGSRAGSPAGSRASVRLTGRGGVVALFTVCFLSLLLAAWTGWAVFAAVVFVVTCGLVACYTRPAGLRSVVVCPPLAFCTGSVLAQLISAPDTFSALAGVLVTLGTSTLWLFTGTALTMAIALGRGWRPVLAATVLGNLRVALRERRPRGDQWVDRRLARFSPSHNVKSAEPPRPLPPRKQTAVPPGDRRLAAQCRDDRRGRTVGKTPYGGRSLKDLQQRRCGLDPGHDIRVTRARRPGVTAGRPGLR